MVGGGNSAVEEALFLTNFATKVTLVHRRDELRAEKVLQERLFNHPKIETIWFQAIDEVIGEKDPRGVTGVRLRDLRTGAERVLPCDGVFVAIGHAPASQLVAGQLELHQGGYVVTRPGSTATSVPGVFAAGDIADPVYRQAVTSAGMGCMAALDAERFLAAHGEAGAPDRFGAERRSRSPSSQRRRAATVRWYFAGPGRPGSRAPSRSRPARRSSAPAWSSAR